MKDFLSKCDQIRSLLGILSHLLKKSLMESFIFCAVKGSWKTLEMRFWSNNSYSIFIIGLKIAITNKLLKN